MQLKINHVLQGCLLTLSCTAFAADATDEGSTNYYQAQANQSLSNVATYLQNLGEYFGYDVTQYCSTGGACSKNSSGYSNALFNANDAYANQLNLFNSYLGSLLGGGSSGSPNYNPIVPPNTQNYSILNTLAGQTYTTPPYTSPSAQSVSANPMLDQQTFQSDPVSQAVFNIITTPDLSFCSTTNSSGATVVDQSCTLLFREKIMSQVVGTLQQPKDVFNPGFTNNQTLVSQLNSDTLVSPMLYTTSNGNQNSTSSSPDNSGQGDGLTAQTQAQQAANFIRYVSSSVNPVNLPTYASYSNLLGVALNYSKQSTPADQAQAQITIFNYLTKLRTYAAQSSVGISNLYYILSKRLPQNPVSGNGAPSSEALNEFTMASWRLYNPNSAGGSGSNQQWLTQINQGSNASVQKEIAILLAEINYQLYLSRQQQERILMTESVLLLQHTQANPPDSDLNSAASSDAAGSGKTTTPTQ